MRRMIKKTLIICFCLVFLRLSCYSQESLVVELSTEQVNAIVLESASEISIAILDTGVDILNSALSGCPINNYFLVGEHNDNRHGTVLAGLLTSNDEKMLGFLPGVCIESIVVGKNDSISFDMIADGIYKAVELDVDIICMSFSTYIDNAQVKGAVDNALKNGIVIISSLGNNSFFGPTYPACYDGVLGVSAVDKNFKELFYANKHYDSVVAVGEGLRTILSTSLRGDYASGTSVAVPNVAAIAAVIKAQNPDLTSCEIINIIKYSADDLGREGQDEVFGFGLVNMERALNKPRISMEVEKNTMGQLIVKLQIVNYQGQPFTESDCVLNIAIMNIHTKQELKSVEIKLVKGMASFPAPTYEVDHLITITSNSNAFIPLQYVRKHITD